MVKRISLCINNNGNALLKCRGFLVFTNFHLLAGYLMNVAVVRLE
jgi:hypothetical protein